MLPHRSLGCRGVAGDHSVGDRGMAQEGCFPVRNFALGARIESDHHLPHHRLERLALKHDQRVMGHDGKVVVEGEIRLHPG
jgi:hypothetical protein